MTPAPPPTTAVLARTASHPSTPGTRPPADAPTSGGEASWPAWAVALLASLVPLALSLWLIAVQIGRPFVYDDVSFIQGARAIADTGRPYGNQGYMLHLYEQRDQWALWHPPLYLYLLGGAVRLFGDSERVARGMGVVCLLVAAAFAFDLARRVVLSRGGSAVSALAAGALAVALYVLNPLALQATMVLDIDNTVLMVLLAAQVWLAVRLPGPWRPLTIIGMAVLFAVALWAKMTTPLALAVALVFTRLFQQAGMRGALQAVAVAILGIVVFAVSWVGISGMLGLPIGYTLDVVRNEAIESSASSRDRLVSLQAFAMGVAPAILWIGPFFCLLFVASGLPRLWTLLRGKGLEAADLLVVLGAAIYLAYLFKLAGNFPKYHAAMLPLWAAASAALVVRAAGRPTILQYAVVVLGLALSAWWIRTHLFETWGVLWEETLNQDLIAVPLLIGLGIAAFWGLVGRRNLLGALPVALAILTVSWSVSLDLYQRLEPGSTTYYYGRHGQREAAAALDAILQPGELYVASKDVAWYASDREYVDQESWQHVVWDLNRGRYDDTYLGMPVRVLVLEIGEETLRWAYDGVLLRRGYQSAGEYGNYFIYVRP